MVIEDPVAAQLQGHIAGQHAIRRPDVSAEPVVEVEFNAEIDVSGQAAYVMRLTRIGLQGGHPFGPFATLAGQHKTERGTDRPCVQPLVLSGLPTRSTERAFRILQRTPAA